LEVFFSVAAAEPSLAAGEAVWAKTGFAKSSREATAAAVRREYVVIMGAPRFEGREGRAEMLNRR
jgi:hypothetical protein